MVIGWQDLVTNVSNNNNTPNRVDIPQIPENDFFSKNYKQGNYYRFADMKRHPDWISEYKNQVKTKKINICKSCRKRFLKGCCSEYDKKNRSTVTMVVDWQGSATNTSNNDNTPSNDIPQTTANNDFFSKNYVQGSVYRLSDMKRHPDWISDYKTQLKPKK